MKQSMYQPINLTFLLATRFVDEEIEPGWGDRAYCFDFLESVYHDEANHATGMLLVGAFQTCWYQCSRFLHTLLFNVSKLILPIQLLPSINNHYFSSVYKWLSAEPELIHIEGKENITRKLWLLNLLLCV